MSDSLFVLKTDFDMITYELRDKTEFLAQNMMRLILDVEQIKQDITYMKADINKMDAKLDLIIKHLKI